MNTEETTYLQHIHSPADLRALPPDAMQPLAAEIRDFLIKKVAQNGGHLASNLGVVELTLALHRVFDTPHDHLIWDVGHQSYVHKIITGRADRFDDLRRPGGLSGFTNRRESEYDPFGAGHSSTSLSAALGFAEADRLAGENRYTVAVIGDGAFTGGMVHEALNNCDKKLPLILVLNENEMSISRNTGAFARYLADIRASRSYQNTKRRASAVLHRLPLIGRPLYRLLTGIRNGLKRQIYRNNFFEDLGFLYLGPVDGNDYRRVEAALRRAKARHAAVIVHIKTRKGAGYPPAEADPSRFHSMAPAGTVPPDTDFHRVFGEELTVVAAENPRVCAITAAMGMGCGLDGFRAAHPDRFFDVGIAEEHAATFAAGMAANGYIPCFAVYSTFLQRAYDNVLHDIALQGLPVKLFIDRAGLAVSDGATHHGIFDVSFLSAIPGMRIFAPATYGSLRAILRAAVSLPGPCAVRYPNAPEDSRADARFYPAHDYENFGLRADFSADEAPNTILITYGGILSRVLDAADAANAEGHRTGVLLLETLKPYEENAAKLQPFLRRDSRVIFVEEGIESGGAGMLTEAALRRSMGADFPSEYRILSIRDHFAAPTERGELYHYCGIGTEDILAAIRA